MGALLDELDPEQYGDLSTERQIQTVFNHACETLGVEVTWGWNDRFLRVLGRARIRDMHIELSSKIWKLAKLEDRKEVIYHEVAHIAAFKKYKSCGHDRPWRLCMMMVGYQNAERCHTIDVSKLTIKNRHPVFCDCTAHMITKIRLNKMRRGVKMSCKKCNGRLREDK